MSRTAVDGAAAPPPRGVRHTRLFLAAYYSLAVAWGLHSVGPPEPSRLDLLLPIAHSVCLGWWALVDARRRGQSIPLLARPWFFLLAALVVAGYVVWSRGWRGAGWVALHGLLWYALATATLYAGWVAVHGWS